MDAEMIKEKDWKAASNNIPLEVHIEMIKIAYTCKMWPEFEDLMESALIRLKFRRYEVPYLATVDVLMSMAKDANIPNGFEKLPRDLNSANLRTELKKLRQSAKKTSGGDGGDAGAGSAATKQADPKKAAAAKPDPKAAAGKKGPADAAPKDAPKEDDEDDVLANEAELEAIKHIYVNLLI
jgi:hypothetical protein